jgi:hypothetical protein
VRLAGPNIIPYSFLRSHMPGRWLVTLESLDVPARAAIEKALQNRCGLKSVTDHCVPSRDDLASCLALMLHRLRALRAHPPPSALTTGSWLTCTPTDPVTKEVYRRVTRALVKASFGGDDEVGHLMLCVRASPDEAFETMIDSFGHPCRDVCLEDLWATQREIDKASAEDTPFDHVQIRHIHCERYATDTPHTLRQVVHAACSACEEVVPRSTWGPRAWTQTRAAPTEEA